MKRKIRLLSLISIFMITLSCTFSGALQRVYDPDEPIAKAPDYAATQIAIPEEDNITWWCDPRDLKEEMGNDWEMNSEVLNDLKLEMQSSGDTLSYTISFTSPGTFLVKRDPDYRPPPGATLVPEGEYKTEDIYQGGGTAQREGYNVQGKIKIDYQLKTFFPETVVVPGTLELLTLGYLSTETDDLQICFDVYAERYSATIQDPSLLMKEYCRWPGYYFICSPQ